ncbi:MAG: hypothetical protein ABFC24_07355 [Methanoregulaceae archaeon]
MQQVTSSRKYQNGIQVSSTYAGEEVNDFFTYEELVDQKINALDLLSSPRIFQVDTVRHTIESSVGIPAGK